MAYISKRSPINPSRYYEIVISMAKCDSLLAKKKWKKFQSHFISKLLDGSETALTTFFKFVKV